MQQQEKLCKTDGKPMENRMESQRKPTKQKENRWKQWENPMETTGEPKENQKGSNRENHRNTQRTIGNLIENHRSTEGKP